MSVRVLLTVPSFTQYLSQVSGDGLLSPLASVPGSGLATGFDSLDVFLVSYQTQLNITVSTGPDLLTQEPGSTVKHLNFPIPSCVPPGQYNVSCIPFGFVRRISSFQQLTFYEESHIDDVPFFSITPLPIIINNPNLSGSCAPGSNPLQPFPQSSSPPSQNPVSPTVTITQSSIPTTVSFPSFTTTVSVSIPTTTTIVSISSSVSTTTVVSVLTTCVVSLPTTFFGHWMLTTLMIDLPSPQPPPLHLPKLMVHQTFFLLMALSLIFHHTLSHSQLASALYLFSGRHTRWCKILYSRAWLFIQ